MGGLGEWREAEGVMGAGGHILGEEVTFCFGVTSGGGGHILSLGHMWGRRSHSIFGSHLGEEITFYL